VAGKEMGGEAEKMAEKVKFFFRKVNFSIGKLPCRFLRIRDCKSNT
jgi:hypothetical protein